ncbi:MAG TPA: deoxyguanosinetriphosphate triphosphohydrolase [Terriglobia bacterium]|nr:deoxyguanosinetriphosphate triphosphohydrolase [Terriglobia bacterium]
MTQSQDHHGLESYAMSVRKTLGRRYPEPLHPYRNEYERDRDRIIHSRAFRRLENKTQVFTRRYSDHFRNRLTHTLEVAQISRTVAGALGLNTDLVEALALVHDVGHPPFGHTGERELNRLMDAHGERFDHNLHALRIVEQFEQKYVNFPGLNLTFEVREGIIKHSRDYDPAQYPELAEYRLEERPPLEAQLIDVADEIAYNCADLDDGFEAKLLSLAQIREKVPVFWRFLRPVERKFPAAPEKLKFNEALRGLMDALVTDLITATQKRLEKMEVRTLADVRRAPRRLVGLSSRQAGENQELKVFLQENLYAHREVRAERQRIVRRVEQLFEFFMEHPRSLPAFYVAKTGDDPIYRVVCDYIAGMTDNYLADQHKKYVEQ